MDKVSLFIKRNHFFNNADLLISSIKDSAGYPVKEKVSEWINQLYELQPKEHNDKSRENGLDTMQIILIRH